MSSGKDTHRHDINVFLHSSFSDLLWGLTKAGVNNFKASVTQSAGNNLRAAIMTIQARFCN